MIRESEGLAARRGRFSFSVHMPDDLKPEHAEILELTRGLAERYILHPPPSGDGEFLRLVDRWRAEYGELFLLENLVGRSFEALAAGLPDLPLCLDTGHLLLNGGGIGDFLERHGSRIGEIHLHGVQAGGGPPALRRRGTLVPGAGALSEALLRGGQPGGLLALRPGRLPARAAYRRLLTGRMPRLTMY